MSAAAAADVAAAAAAVLIADVHRIDASKAEVSAKSNNNIIINVNLKCKCNKCNVINVNCKLNLSCKKILFKNIYFSPKKKN